MASVANKATPKTELKLNLGCGHNKLEGYINVDSATACQPELVCDLNQTPWPWKKNSVAEVVFYHALEHMGATSEEFFAIMQELYRVCRHDALIQITVPHPRHDNFISDPTHVRAITPQLMSLLSLKNCDLWQAQGASNTPLAHYLHVDFETVHAEVKLDEPYASALNNGQIKPEDAVMLLRERNNIATEFTIHLRVVKP
ncbi:MAG: hypothetical protein QM533_04040 [Cytophagales bacterium]|nr:hypothetical protein [Cytophagales bacterium]